MGTDKPVLVIIAGPNGSGKTTITEQFLRHKWGSDCTYINPDQIARDVFGDWNSDDAVLKAAEYAEKKRNELLKNRQNIVFETVMSSREKVEFIRRAKDAGYFIRIFFVATSSPAINAKRVALRYMKGGHSVPIQKIVSRFAGSIENCAEVIKIADRLYIYDNSEENRMARLLFRVADGRLAKQYETEIPLWARPLLAICL